MTVYLFIIPLYEFIYVKKKDISLEDFIKKLNKKESLDKETILFVIKGVINFKESIDEPVEKSLFELNMKNPKLFQVFTLLNERYISIKKTKEEFSKFLFRKSFKFIKKNLEEKKKGMMKKNIKKLYLETYFKTEENEETKNIGQLFPFKKNSIIKRINSKYLNMLFSNENYFSEFQDFLQKYDGFVLKENEKKIVKLMKQIMKLIAEDHIENIMVIQHFPWLKSWIASCKEMGKEALKNVTLKKKLDKKFKV